MGRQSVQSKAETRWQIDDGEHAYLHAQQTCAILVMVAGLK